MKDGILLALLVVSFASFSTAHVMLAVRLLLKKPRYRGVVGFFVAPLGLVWAFREGWRRLASVWLCSVVVYVVALVAERSV